MLIVSHHVRNFGLVSAIIQHSLALLLKLEHVFVPVLAELFINLLDRHTRDRLLRGLERIGSKVREVGLLEVDRRVVQGDRHRVPGRDLLVKRDLTFLLEWARYQTQVLHFMLR